MNKTNFIIDTGIFIAFLIAMEPRLGGLAVHEWISLALAATIIIHLLLHWNWVICIAGRFFKQLWHSSRLKFLVDLLLFVGFIAIMLSGLMISKIVLPSLGLNIQASLAWRSIHALAADLSMLLVALHFALNWNWVWCQLKKYVLFPIAKPFKSFKPAQLQPIINTTPKH